MMFTHRDSTSSPFAYAARAGFAALPLLAAACFALPASAGDASPEGAAKAVLKAEIGKPAPDFILKDTEGRDYRLSDYKGKTVVLEWFNPECPFVRKHHVQFHTMADLSTQLGKQGVVWLAINSNAPGKQGSGLERNKQARAEYKIEYPLLLDETGVVGRMYGAKTTPHMYVISPEGVLVYRGAIDNDPSPRATGSTNYVRASIAHLQAGEKIDPSETTSYGCSVKYAQ